MKTEKLNRESLKAMESRIEDKLQKRQDKRVKRRKAKESKFCQVY